MICPASADTRRRGTRVVSPRSRERQNALSKDVSGRDRR
jgi:hypothetical protein